MVCRQIIPPSSWQLLGGTANLLASKVVAVAFGIFGVGFQVFLLVQGARKCISDIPGISSASDSYRPNDRFPSF